MFDVDQFIHYVTEAAPSRELHARIARVLASAGSSVRVPIAMERLAKQGIRGVTREILKTLPGWHLSGEYLHKNRPIFERATPVVFHYTSIYNALKIMTSGKFALTPDHGTEGERSLSVKNKPYYLSTTRSAAQGEYHSWSSSGVLFTLDGDWFNRKGYVARPINYWSPFGSSGKDEMEDRIYADTPYIPIDAITEAHILVNTKDPRKREPTDLRQLLIALKKRGTPAFLYTDMRAWQLQNHNKRVAVSKVDLQGHIYGMDRGKEFAWYYPSDDTRIRQARSRGQDAGYTDNYGSFRPYRPSTLYQWLEIIHKKATDELTPGAQSLSSDLAYGRYERDTLTSLSNEFHNNRNPDQAGRKYYDAIAAIMKQRGWRSAKDLQTAMAAKWKQIKTREVGS